MLHSRNVQSIIETLDPRRKFLELAKKNVDQKEIKTPEEVEIAAAPKRIDEKINDAMKDASVGTSANASAKQTTETFSPKPVAPVSASASTEKFNPLCPLSSPTRVNTTVCVVIEIILLLLTFLVCLVSYNCCNRFTRKQIELTKETCKQNKKIIKLLKSMMN
jgi:hypothetical protein